MNLLLHLLGVWLCAAITFQALTPITYKSRAESLGGLFMVCIFSALFTLGWYLIRDNWGAI